MWDYDDDDGEVFGVVLFWGLGRFLMRGFFSLGVVCDLVWCLCSRNQTQNKVVWFLFAFEDSPTLKNDPQDPVWRLKTLSRNKLCRRLKKRQAQQERERETASERESAPHSTQHTAHSNTQNALTHLV